MSYDELERTWQSPQNRPDAAALAATQQRFHHELHRRRTGWKIFLGVIFLVLTVLTVRFAWYVFAPEAGQPAFDVRREWAPVLFLVGPWVGVLFLLRRMARHEREHGLPGATLREGVRALLDENRLSRARVKTAAWLHGAALLLLPFVVWQLRATGKAGDEILVPAFVAWPLAVACIGVGMAWHYRAKLLPRQRQLEALLRDFERAD